MHNTKRLGCKAYLCSYVNLKNEKPIMMTPYSKFLLHSHEYLPPAQKLATLHKSRMCNIQCLPNVKILNFLSILFVTCKFWCDIPQRLKLFKLVKWRFVMYFIDRALYGKKNSVGITSSILHREIMVNR